METLKKKKSANIAHAEQTDQLLSKNIWDDVESVSKHAVLIKLKTIAWSFSEPCLCVYRYFELSLQLQCIWFNYTKYGYQYMNLQKIFVKSNDACIYPFRLKMLPLYILSLKYYIESQ